MTVLNQKFDVELDAAAVTPAPQPAAVPDRSTSPSQLRRAMIKLAFAGLLTACAVFEIYGIVQTVAQGAKRIASATQSVRVLDNLQSLTQSLPTVATGLGTAASRAEVAAQVDVMNGQLHQLDLLAGTSGPVPGGLQLRASSQALIAQTYAALGLPQSAPQWDAVAQSQVAMTNQIATVRSAEEYIAQDWLGGVVSQARINVFVMILFLAGTVFLLSTVMVSGHREMRRREEIESELRSAVQDAQDSERAKTQFLATMSHEIRTPLNAIIGFSELLGQEELKPDQLHQVNRLNTAGRTLSRIVDDVLDLSKIEAGGMDLRDEAFSPNELFREAIDLVSVHSQAKGLMLTSEVTSGMPRTVRGDSLRLSQVLLNLLNNAIKFTPEGYVTLRVSSNEADDNHVRMRIEVQDSGIGISDADQEKLFDRFSQMANGVQAHGGGSGLGLAIAQGLVRSMGGDINVYSRVGEGTTFWFYLTLPVVERLAPADDEPKEKAKLPDRAISVLLIDDSEDTCELVNRILGREGVTVKSVADPTQALKQIIDQNPDVILCDMQMPQMSGMELTRQIRALPLPYRETPLVAFSASTMQSEIEEMLMAGADAFLAKPFHAMDLLDAICGVFAGAGVAMQPPTVPSETFRELDELVKLMGPNWTMTFLTRLSDRLEVMIGPESTRVFRTAEAHKVVAEAGQMGLRDLAWSASALEQCLRKDDKNDAVEQRFCTEAKTFLARLPAFKARITKGS